jgi:signal transduction histidine kinase/CheY-like chemotaxis protein
MSPERVLVVDDDDALLNLMGLALRRRGYEVEQASDGFSALKVLASQPPFSVLLTDLMMPGMSGLELLREARKLDEHIQSVVVTAAPDLESAITAMRADGAYDYLLKPFESMSQLLLAVERAAAQRRLILEREQLRQKVQSEAERLRALITNTGDAIFSASADGVLQIANPAANRLVGTESLEGTDALKSLPPALSTLISNWKMVGGNLPAVVEMPWMDGTIQMVSLTPIPENGGDQWGWVTVLRDITHVKRMEELKSQMLVEAASRIRIPLAQAMNALVELNILTSQNPRVSEVVFRLTQVWKRIQEWGDDLNALIRIDSGITLQSTQIHLGTILDEVRQNQEDALTQTADIKLELNVEPELPQVIADPELIRRLLNGLINRAMSRSDKGGTIRLYARNHDGQVWISVSDDGPAVSEADLPRIFEKSFVKAGAGPGVTGLEMALVKTIIDRMGGQVWVGGQGKRGSTILVCLPSTDQNNP